MLSAIKNFFAELLRTLKSIETHLAAIRAHLEAEVQTPVARAVEQAVAAAVLDTSARDAVQFADDAKQLQRVLDDLEPKVRMGDVKSMQLVQKMLAGLSDHPALDVVRQRIAQLFIRSTARE